MFLEKTLSVELAAVAFGKSVNKTATRGEPVEDIRILGIGKPDERWDCSACFNLHGVTSDGTGAAVVVVGAAVVVVGAAVVVAGAAVVVAGAAVVVVGAAVVVVGAAVVVVGAAVVVVGAAVVVVGTAGVTAVSEVPPQAETHKSKQNETINFFT